MPLDPQALAAHAGFVRRLALDIVRDEQTADDVVQETFLAALRSPPRDGSRPRAWLARVAKNIAISFRRRDTRRTRRETLAPRRAPEPSAAELVSRLEIQRRVVDAVLALEEPFRYAVLLRYFEGLPLREVARRTATPAETVRVRLRRARERLRRTLDDREGGRGASLLLLLPLMPRGRGLALLGVIAMGKKSIAVAALLLLAALASLTYLRRSHTERARPAEAANAPAAATSAPEAASAGVQASDPLPPPVDLATVDRERDLHGIVVREHDGSPVAGARLQAVVYPWRRTPVLNREGFFEVVTGPSARSAEDGTFKLPLRAGELVALRVTAEGLAPLELSMRQAGERVRVQMAPGVALTVVARDSGGRPAAGTRLRLFRADSRGDAAFDVRGTTDEEGRHRFTGLPAGASAYLDAEHDSWGHPNWQPITLSALREQTCELIMPEGRTLSGRIVDAVTRAPVAGAHVGMNWVMEPGARTDATGCYVLRGWTGKGVTDIHVLADGYGRAQRVVGADVTIDFELFPADSAVGRILGADGRAVRGACLTAIASSRVGNEQQICSRSARSGADGRFVLDGLRRDLAHTLVVMAAGHGRYLLDFGAHPDGPGAIDLGDVVLPSPVTIRGHVVDAKGVPQARVPVTLSGTNADRGRLTALVSAAYFHYGTSETRHTDDLGRFTFPDQSPGAYTLRVRRSGAADQTREVKPDGKSPRVDVEIVLEAGDPFRVQVTDDLGTPIGNAYVNLVTASTRLTAQTAVDGSAAFTVGDAVTEASASPPYGADYAPARVVVETGATGCTLILRRTESVAGRLLDDKGAPIANCWVAAKQGDDTVAQGRTDSGGSFRVAVPRGASCELVVTGVETETGLVDGTRFRAAPITVRAGAQDIVLVASAVPRDRTLSVRVLLPDGTPVAGARVWAREEFAMTDAEGRCTFTGLSALETQVGALRPDNSEGPPIAFPRPETVVPEGQEIVLRFRTASPIEGVLYGPDGTPAAGVPVLLKRGSGLVVTTGTGPEGRFSLIVAADEEGPLAIDAQRSTGGSKILRAYLEGVRPGDRGLRLELK
jgi:RNA polymerase sigma-70 factor (ECF subfamily)